ncbi:hypothetical protein [Streptomyces minutiscleroticus]|uniref:Uncharacterized protein n=1 Tax=Streptomyces minutiscleroticus TaxID=68238 RepID=A0A918KAN4_9ACTN|nr:hypothetical protein [Streptomyces minutiscleroticus]GGX56741.1 hypothetical protein GCM10010358_08480 [Streptomyces minutiscleroticus]
MTVDPTDPEILDIAGTTGPAESDVEAPEADAAEQHTDVAPRQDEPVNASELYDADEADRAEQARVVDLDEDDYR